VKRPDMPALRAYRRGEMSAREAVVRAQYMDEAEAIIEEAEQRRVEHSLDGAIRDVRELERVRRTLGRDAV
jgi:orotidine-5'-phosphate decarboxylase